jgi:hypothetical protein
MCVICTGCACDWEEEGHWVAVFLATIVVDVIVIVFSFFYYHGVDPSKYLGFVCSVFAVVIAYIVAVFLTGPHCVRPCFYWGRLSSYCCRSAGGVSGSHGVAHGSRKLVFTIDHDFALGREGTVLEAMHMAVVVALPIFWRGIRFRWFLVGCSFTWL